GFIPWALCNFLALLGWSSSDDREFFSREELIEAFSLEGIVRHNSIFNYVPGDPDIWTDPKAINMNARYLSMISLDELIPLVREELRSAGLWDEAFDSERRAWFAETVNLIRTRYYTLKDFSSRGRCYFSDNFPFEPVALDKNLKKDAAIPEYLKILADALENTASFDTDHAEQTVRKVCESLQIKPGLLINAVRTAVTGQMAGPGLFEILEVLGKEKTVQRLRSAAGRLEQNVL
ncbi:MAG TPA: glutamate--tRNA ligase, partial [Thermodesulfobacteriota bacterium]|nr:glutamate--tRNA ligase [Thermodesulfobacteriota bacterium]